MNRLFFATVAISFAAFAFAQPRADTVTLIGEAPATHKRLLEIQQRLANGEDVLSELLTVIDTVGDDLVRTERADIFVPARRLTQTLIGQLPKDQLGRYQARVAAAAKAKYQAATVQRAERPLVELIETYEHATIANDARLLLGDLQFEHGRMDTAEATWERLADGPELRRRKEIIPEYRKKNPPVRSAWGTWSTLGNDAGRSGRTDAKLPSAWPSLPTWRVPLIATDGPRRPDALTNSVAWHPVVLNDVIYLANANQVVAVPVGGGTAKTVYTSGTRNVAVEKPKSHTVDFALTVANGSLYGRFGASALWADPTHDDPVAPASEIVRLVPQPDGSLTIGWRKVAPENTSWLGAPAVVDGRIVVSSVTRNGNRLKYTIHCFDEAGTLWERNVAEADLPSGEPKSRHDLVSVSDDTIVFNSQVGVTIALDVVTGRPLWAWRYPRLIPSGKTLAMAWTANHRDVCPPAIHDGVAVIAPTDAARVAGFELRTGRLLWEHVGYHTETIIGIANRKAVAVMAGPIRGVRAFDLRTGLEDMPDGWANMDDPGLASLGRGLVSDEIIVWPTRAGLYTLHAKTGRPATVPLLGPHGNLAFAKNTLIVANPTELVGYVVK